MSKARPSYRDRLEADYLALAAERARVMSEFDAKLVAMQRELERVECPRLREGERELGPREDGIDRLRRAEGIAAAELQVDLGLAEDEAREVAQELSSGLGEGAAVNWERRAARVLAFAVGMLRRVASPETKNPRLEAMVGLFALGAEVGASMRDVAKAYGCTVAWVSQRTEETRVRFNLPKNQHNKSDDACASYSVARELTKRKKAA